MNAYKNIEVPLSELAPDTLVLTANRRLTRFLEARIGREFAQKNIEVWPSLNCLSLNGWFNRQWNQIQSEQMHPKSNAALLSSAQESILWQNTFEQKLQGFALFNVQETAEKARQAWQNLRLWRLNVHSLENPLIEIQQLQTLVTAAEEFMCSHKLIDATALMEIVLSCHQQALLPPPKKVLLHGFEEFSPLVSELFDCWQSQGCEMNNLAAPVKSARVQTLACLDEENALFTAARWAASLVSANNTNSDNTDTNFRIGIIIPELVRLRPRVERIFNAVFEPQTALARNKRHSPGFNISAGQSLAQTAPIATALLALELNNAHMEVDTLTRLLLSPYFSDSEELPDRSLMAVLVRQKSDRFRRSEFLTLVSEFCRGEEQESERQRCPHLRQHLQEFMTIVRTQKATTLSPAKWAEVFEQQLHVLGWPGSRMLNTLEYQQLKKWPAVLEAFAALDLVITENISLASAIHYLQQCANTDFQAKTMQSPVQILGLLEAAGMEFDHLWVMQMDEKRWPMPPDPNPFLPYKLQYEKNMPRASSKAELVYAKHFTQRLATSAEEVIFSYTQFEGDCPMQASSLISHYPAGSHVDQYREISYTDLVAKENHDMQSFVDSCGPLVQNPQALRGGTEILKDQAACHFRAFSRHRLHAERIDDAEKGISARERGILIHQSLDNIWHKLRTQKKLLQLSFGELKKLVENAVAAAWSAILRNREHGASLVKIESTRTINLILTWMELEKNRAPFKVIQREKSKAIKFSGLPLKIRYDRLDELEDGSHFVIDYKTGLQDIRAWGGMRPDEPQIPVYVLAHKQKIQSAAFGLLNTKEQGFKGLSKHNLHTPGLKLPEELNKIELPTCWEDILQQWQKTLDNLAREFVVGSADVNPKNPGTTCRYCGLQGLCRVREFTYDENVDHVRDAPHPHAFHQEHDDERFDS